MRKSRLLSYVSISLVLFLMQSFVYGQGAGIPIECGNIIEADFVSNPPRSNLPGELYNIELESGDRLEITLTPLTELTAVAMTIFDPDGVSLY